MLLVDRRMVGGGTRSQALDFGTVLRSKAVYVFLHTHTNMCVCVYIYIERER